MTASTEFTVKNPATTIITTATARFVLMMVIDVIHPLSKPETCKRKKGVISHFLCNYYIQYIIVH